MCYETNNKRLLDHLEKNNLLSEKELFSIIKSKNYNPNILNNDGFGLIFECVEWSNYKLLKHLLKHEEIDTSINLDQVVSILITSNNYRTLRFFLKYHKNLILEKYKNFFNDFFKEHIEEQAGCTLNNTIYFPHLKCILLYFSVIEEKLDENDINKYSKTINIKDLTYQKLLNHIS